MGRGTSDEGGKSNGERQRPTRLKPGRVTALPAGSSLIEPGVTPSTPVRLSWESFTGAAEEAGMSRLFGGIHISDSNVGGLKLGQEVAKRAWSKAQTYFNGD